MNQTRAFAFAPKTRMCRPRACHSAGCSIIFSRNCRL